MTKDVPRDKPTVTADDVTAGVRAAGVAAGDVVMFHSSLSSMGYVVGGADAVIDGFLAAVSPGGTVAVPSLWWTGTGTEDVRDWDRDRSPSYPGLITETLRRRRGAARSDNPTHAVAAIGSQAAELTADHGPGPRRCLFGDRAFAQASPWQRLYDWNAAYGFLGVDFTYNTMGHFCEVMLIQWVLSHAPPHERETLQMQVAGFENFGDLPDVIYPSFSFQQMGVRLRELGLVRASRIGAAEFQCIRTRAMVDATLTILKAEPEQWFTRPRWLPWMKSVLAG